MANLTTQRRRGTVLSPGVAAALALLAAGAAASSALALQASLDEETLLDQDLLNTWTFPNNVVFGGPMIPPIPAGFFAPGSNPFVGTINYSGVPIDPVNFGNVDTIVQRLGVPIPLGAPIGAIGQVPIEIVSLNLVSINPITVTYDNGNPPTLWDVTINLSNLHPPPGQVMAHKSHPNGGTFDAFLPIMPRFTFTNVDPPFDVRVLDTGELGFPPFPLQIDDAHWVHNVSPMLPIIQPPGPWVPGVREVNPGNPSSQVLTPFTARTPLIGIEHTVCPGTVKEERCELLTNDVPRDMSACTNINNADGTRTVRVTFAMNATFRANCSCCEYRQFVRGRFQYNGRRLVHTMNPGVLLDPLVFREDGFGVPTPAGSNQNYGRRGQPNNPAHDRYSNPAARGAGCDYHGTDAPGLYNMRVGRAYVIDLEFQGKIIDVCNGTELRSDTWDVDCAGVAFGPPPDPLVEVLQETFINGRSALLGVYVYPGNVLAVVTGIANGFGEIPIDAAEVDVDVTGLVPLDVPEPGALPETRGGGSMAQAVYDFAYPNGGPDPVQVSFTYGPETQQFDVDLPPLPCPFDLDNSGDVGINDLLILLAAWGNPYGINDLLSLLAAWGPC